MATKIKRKILSFGEFKKGKNTLETAEKHPIKEGIIPSDANDEENQAVESSPEDDLKSNFRSWEADHDNEDDANGLFAILMSRHPNEKEEKLRELAFHWVGYEEKTEEGLDEAKKEKAPKEASIFKRNILDFNKFKKGKDTVQKEKLKPVKENESENSIHAPVDNITIDKHVTDSDETRIIKWMHDNMSNQNWTTDLTGSILTIITKDLELQDYEDLCNYLDSQGFPIMANEAELSEELTQEAKDFISRKIKKLVGEGRPHDQAVAMAYSYAKREGYDVPEK